MFSRRAACTAARSACSCGRHPTSSSRVSGRAAINRWQRAHKQVEAFVGRKNDPDETYDGVAGQAEFALQCFVSGTPSGTRRYADRIGITRDARLGHTTSGPMSLSAPRRSSSRGRRASAPRSRAPARHVTQPAFAAGAVVNRRVFPEGAHFVRRQESPAGRPTRNAGSALRTGEWAWITCGFTCAATSAQAARGGAHQREFAQHRQPGETAPAARACDGSAGRRHLTSDRSAQSAWRLVRWKVSQPSRRCSRRMARVRKCSRCAAGSSGRGRAARAASYATALRRPLAPHDGRAGLDALRRVRRNASNINTVHSGAL